MSDLVYTPTPAPIFLLGIDTCGPSGSVALGRLEGDALAILGQSTLEGRSYSATLVAAVGELLSRQSLRLKQVGCIVVVSGPGSFTGVRVGLSVVKGLSEGAGVPVIAVSRLEALAAKADVSSAALDAHRHEVFLYSGGREVLAGTAELAGMVPAPARIAACDEAASRLLAEAWPSATVVRAEPPTASDAMALAIPRIRSCRYVDVALLDGHYLRRSDAEIFGEQAAAPAHSA